MKILRLLVFGLVVTVFMGCNTPASALANSSNQLVLDSFTGVYHLSRDSHNLSLLTSEETIVAEFPGSGFTGITRALPQTYQRHSVELKVLSVSDAAGNPVPYKTAPDNKGNLVITTGDPSIKLYGSQTYHIRYQTTGVVDLGHKSDDFVLNVNGRGWDEPFNRVNATLYIPASFQARLVSEPTCYTSQLNVAFGCTINVQKNSQQIVITSESRNLAAHQALVMKLSFKPATFTNKHPGLSFFLPIGAVALVGLGLGTIYIRRKSKTANV